MLLLHSAFLPMKHFPLFLQSYVEGFPGGSGKLSIVKKEKKNNQL